jgi:outer membrane protein assembly factor BamB
MQMMRSLSVALFVFVATFASAQFNGPAPLAWRWQPTSGQAASGSPLVEGDSIFVASGGRIYAIDRATGNKKWQFPAESPIPTRFPTAPIMADGVLVATGGNKIMYGLDPATGNSKWSFVLPGSPTGQPVLVGKTVVQAQGDNQLIAVDPATGQSPWKNPDTGDLQGYTIIDGIYGQISGYGSTILYFTARNQLHAVDVVTRQENLWARPVTFTQIDAYAQPTVFNDTIYVASGEFLVAINPATGNTIWQTPTGFETDFAPVASTQGVFVCSRDGTAMLYGLQDGLPTAGMPKPIALGSYPQTKPSAAGDDFVVPTTSGAIDLVDPTTGAIIWNYVVRPIGKVYEAAPTANGQTGGAGGSPGGPGGAGGGLGGPGGGLGGGLGGGQSRGGGLGGANTKKEIYEIVASGPAVLDGSTLLLPAEDGSLLAFDNTLGVDLTPPTVEMQFPFPGDQVSGLPPLLLYFKIGDEGSGINEKTLEIKIDGRPFEFTYKIDGFATVYFSSEGKNRLLADGRHDITVDVSDWLGNVAHESFALTIDNSLPALVLPGTPKTTTGPGGKGGPGGGGGGGSSGGD